MQFNPSRSQPVSESENNCNNQQYNKSEPHQRQHYTKYHRNHKLLHESLERQSYDQQGCNVATTPVESSVNWDVTRLSGHSCDDTKSSSRKQKSISCQVKSITVKCQTSGQHDEAPSKPIRCSGWLDNSNSSKYRPQQRRPTWNIVGNYERHTGGGRGVGASNLYTFSRDCVSQLRDLVSLLLVVVFITLNQQHVASLGVLRFADGSGGYGLVTEVGFISSCLALQTANARFSHFSSSGFLSFCPLQSSPLSHGHLIGHLLVVWIARAEQYRKKCMTKLKY